MSNALSLIGRILVALVFLLTVWMGSPNAGYLGSLGLSPPTIWSVVARTVEWLIVISLVFGIATRYGALLGILYVIVATALAHRFWAVPDAQWVAQYTNFSKNLAILGGLILVYASDAGTFTIDHVWTSRRSTA